MCCDDDDGELTRWRGDNNLARFVEQRYVYLKVLQDIMFGKQLGLRAVYALSENKPSIHPSTYQAARM